MCANWLLELKFWHLSAESRHARSIKGNKECKENSIGSWVPQAAKLSPLVFENEDTRLGESG